MLNIFALSKSEKKKRQDTYCKHGHNGIDHPCCYEKSMGLEEKVGFLDIETSNLKATYGYIFSYCIKEEGGKILGRPLTQKEIRSAVYDKELIKECLEDIRKFDKIITYYGGDFRFDNPFLRTRATYWGLDFPIYKEVRQLDLYPIIKKKFCFHSNKLGVVCDFLGIPSKAHSMNPNVWFGANAGHRDSLKYVFQHNREDVISTEKLYKKIINFVGRNNISI